MDRSFSIIIPTFHRAAQLKDCLGALSKLDYPRARMEVIVVDDGGAEPLDDIVLRSQWGFSARLLRPAHGGPASARNHGAHAAQGDYLAFTDDDCCPEPHWLRELNRGFELHGDALIGGHTVNGLAANRFSAASQSMVDYLYDYFHVHQTRSRFFTSNNLAVPRTLFLELGGFDIRYPLAAAEDRELCAAWQAQGRALAYAPLARVLHFHQLSFRSFWAQHFRYGRGAACLHGRERQSDSGSAQTNGFFPLHFYLGMFVFPFQRERLSRAASLAGCLLTSQLAHTIGFCTELLAPVHNRVSEGP